MQLQSVAAIAQRIEKMQVHFGICKQLQNVGLITVTNFFHVL